MNEVILLIDILNSLLKEDYTKEDNEQIIEKYRQLNEIPVLYPELNWEFIEQLNTKDKKEIKQWVERCMKTVWVVYEKKE